MKGFFISKVRNAHLIIVFLVINFVFGAGFFLYHYQTAINTEIRINSNKKSSIDFITPTGGIIHHNTPSKETIVIYKRPLKNIVCICDGKTYTLKDHKNFSQVLSEKGIQIRFDQVSKELLKDNFHFLILQKFHYPLLIADFILLLIFIIVNWKTIPVFFSKACCRAGQFIQNAINNINKIVLKKKNKSLRLLISNKPGTDYIAQFNKVRISKGAFMVLIIISLLYLAGLFAGILHHNTIVSDFDGLRALTALEMKISGNYVAPTLSGEYYLSKPPLYSYLLLPFVDSAAHPEFKLRLVTVISVILLSILVFVIALYQYDKRRAVFASLLFSTSVLFYYDLSNRIIVDPFLSVLTVSLYFLNFRMAQKNNYLLMFVSGYTITAFAFLTKGFPALYFQAVSIIAIGVTFKSFRKIFSLHHLVGILSFLLIIGAGMLFYSKYNDPLLFIDRLFFYEAGTKYNKMSTFAEVISNILSFPGKSVIYYGPILFLLPLFFIRNNIYFVVKDKFVFYALLLSFLVSLAFFSGYFKPYYILSIVPLLVVSLVKFISLLPVLSVKKRIIMILVSVTSVIMVFICEKIITFQSFPNMDYFYFAIFGLIVFLLIIIFPKKYIVVFMLSMCLVSVIRVTDINNFIKGETTGESSHKEDAKRIISKVDHERLILYPSNIFEQHASLYYLTYFYNRIICKTDECSDSSTFYLATPEKIPAGAIVIDSIVNNNMILQRSAKTILPDRKFLLFKIHGNK